MNILKKKDKIVVDCHVFKTKLMGKSIKLISVSSGKKTTKKKDENLA